MVARITLPALLLCLLAFAPQASGAEPTNTPVSDHGPTWTAVVWPTSVEPTNTPVVDVLPYPTSTPLPTATIGETWTWPPPVLWLPMISKGE